MIELNLIEKKNANVLPQFAGIDLNALNIKLVFIAILILYLPEIIMRSVLDDQVNQEMEVLQKTKNRITEIQNEITKNKNTKNMISVYNEQVDKLRERSKQVEEILKQRTNPQKILEKIARSMSPDVWIESLVILPSRELIISGGAYTPRSVGDLITQLNDSPFFAGTIVPTNQVSKTVEGEGQFEHFELKGNIKNFDMRAR